MVVVRSERLANSHSVGDVMVGGTRRFFWEGDEKVQSTV
jgi:hypothetical protein